MCLSCICFVATNFHFSCSLHILFKKFFNNTESLGKCVRRSVKALGIVFTYNTTVQLQKNFYDKLKDIRTQTRSWSCQGLSLFVKITIIKSFLLPKMLYILSVLPAPEAFIKQLNTIIYNFCGRDPTKMLDQQ